MMRWFAILLILTLVGCTRPAVEGIAQPVEGLAVQQLYVATQRTAGQRGQIFGEQRSAVMNYGRVAISIPQGHVEGMIERSSGQVDPRRFFAPVGVDRFDDARALTRAIRQDKAGDGSVMIYVHGYNNTLEDAAFRLAQIRHDFDLPEPALLFSWPSAGDPRGYIYDRDSVLFARDGFEQLIRDLRANGQRKIFIMAHSMGAYLAMESLRQMAMKGDRHVMDAISAVVLMSPDIDPDVFRQQAQVIGPLPQPFVIMTSQKDRVLDLAGWLTGHKPRLGRIESDEAVAGLNVTVMDLTDFDDGSAGGHLVAVSSASAIRVLRGLDAQFRHGTAELRDFVLLGKDNRTGAAIRVIE